VISGGLIKSGGGEGITPFVRDSTRYSPGVLNTSGGGGGIEQNICYVRPTLLSQVI
jgi:hypothetical protein